MNFNRQIGRYPADSPEYWREERMKTKVFTWDWKEQPPLESIVDEVVQMKDETGNAYIYQPETNCDEYAAVISDTALTDAEAESVYRKDRGYED